MLKKWNLKKLPDSRKVLELSQSINVNKVLAGILVQRGIATFNEAKSFFKPQLADLHDPFLMADMDKAVQRLITAEKKNEKILIYGDYDVDGTTAVVLVYGFLRDYFPNIDYYIPDRHTEGYGISETGINYALDNRVKLIISLDCGIKAVSKVKLANKKGINFIICDHHEPGDELPEAIAVLDPKRVDCNYPYKELSGCGVGFKLLHAFCQLKNINPAKLYKKLDLVAISICADIVPITGENRILAFFGLLALKDNPCLGLKELLKISPFKHINTSAVVFGIAPRINAAGRIKHARAAVKLLLEENKDNLAEMSLKINQYNNSRKELDSSITKEALEMIRAQPNFDNLKTSVVHKKDWHKGVIGIVASRCIEKVYRPTIVLTEENGKLIGSARSVKGFDIYKAISSCEDLLDQYGGHAFAAGLSLSKERLQEFKKRFNDIVVRLSGKDTFLPCFEADIETNLNQITPNFYTILTQIEPFGPGNMKPVFMTRQLMVNQEPRVLKDQHLKFNVTQSQSNAILKCIAFGQAEHYKYLTNGKLFSMIYTIEENEFLNRKTLQLNVKDISPE